MLGRVEALFHPQAQRMNRLPVHHLDNLQIISKTHPDIDQHMTQAEKVKLVNHKSNRQSCVHCVILLLASLQPAQSRSHAQVVWQNRHLRRNCGILYNN